MLLASNANTTIGGDFPVDLSILTKNNGDTANNTNRALACGAGSAMSNGTNWKNPCSGTTY